MNNTRIRWLLAFAIALTVLECDIALAASGGGKVTSGLMALHAEYAAHMAARSATPFAPTRGMVRMVDQHVMVDAVAGGDPQALTAELVALGARNISIFGRVVSCEVPIAAIPALEQVTSLRFARAAYAFKRAGSVTSEGDQAMRSDIARTTFGVSGAGVQVGVLSDSFNCLGGAARDVMTGDLSPVDVLEELPGCNSGTDEGRAMLQIVHDVAPGASLSFATAFTGVAAFANNILALQANGASVIVEDIGYFSEPFFQDGVVAQAADTAVRRGAAYFSAAGNDARNSYESAFRPGATLTDGQFPIVPGRDAPKKFAGGVAHNFATSGPEDHFQRITIPSGSRLSISFQWDSPFLSAVPPGVSGAGSPNDMDIYIFNAAGTAVVGGSIDDNIGGDAVESVEFTNTGPTADFNIMLVWFQGSTPTPSPGFVKYLNLNSVVTINEFNTASSTIIGQPNAAGAVAVGAASFDQTPAFGVTPPVLESFSSAGGTPIRFDIDGNRLPAPVIRRKPEIVAPDNVSNTFFPGPPPPPFPKFLGTSAAAPHAAAVAALIRQKQPILLPVSISQALQSTAIDMGLPGFDFDSGFGLIQADRALGLVSTLNAEAAAILPSSRSVQVGNTATAFATVANAGPGTAVGVGIYSATSLLASFTYQTTDPVNNAPTGQANVPADIPPGGAQTYIISVGTSGTFAPTDAQFYFAGANTLPVAPISGLNTLLLSSTSTPGPDVVALAATITGPTSLPLTVDVPGSNGLSAFAAAALNVGAAGTIVVTADKGSLPVNVLVCQTDSNARCVNPTTPATSATVNIAHNDTPAFALFVQGQGSAIPFDPARNRISAVFRNQATGIVVGRTSVAVRTVP